MEPDTITPNSMSMLHGAGSSNLIHGSQGMPSNMIIRSFSTAINVLKAHTFKDVTDFLSASHMAAELYARTHETVNTADISNLQAARSNLHPVDNFLAYISTLHASLAAIEQDSPIVPSLLTAFRNVVRETDPLWARAVPERWAGSARHAVRLAKDTPGTARALSLVQTLNIAANKLCKESDELVPIHADFLAVCLHAKYYRYAAQWTRQQRRLHVNLSSKIRATDVHLIYYYSTLVLIGVKDFRAALQTCRLALVVPAPSAGTFFSVAKQTFKIYVLLHVLVTGKMPATLKFSSYQIGSLRKVASEYMELAIAFENKDMVQVRQVIESNRETFEKNGNLGIVKQLVDALFKQLIARLSNSYVKMTLQEVAEKVGLNSEEDAEKLLLEMIETRRVSAFIDERAKVVRLMDHDEMNGELSSQNCTASMTQCLNIMARLHRFREDVECDPEYVKKDLAGQPTRKQTPTAGGFASSNADIPLGVAEIEAEFIR